MDFLKETGQVLDDLSQIMADGSDIAAIDQLKSVEKELLQMCEHKEAELKTVIADLTAEVAETQKEEKTAASKLSVMQDELKQMGEAKKNIEGRVEALKEQGEGVRKQQASLTADSQGLDQKKVALFEKLKSDIKTMQNTLYLYHSITSLTWVSGASPKVWQGAYHKKNQKQVKPFSFPAPTQDSGAVTPSVAVENMWEQIWTECGPPELVA